MSRSWWIRAAALLIVGCLLLFGAFAWTSRQDAKAADLTIFFQPSATSTQIEDVKRSLDAMPEVRSVRYLDKAQVLAEKIAREKRTGIDDLIVDSVPGSPTAYRVWLHPRADPHVTGSRLRDRAGTLSVVYPGE